MKAKLTPTQQSVLDGLLKAIEIGNTAALWAPSGMGRTTILREAHEFIGGRFIGMQDVVDSMRDEHPLAIEENFLHLIQEALNQHDAVLIDDLHLLTEVICGCGGYYPRYDWLDASLTVLAEQVQKSPKKLVVAVECEVPAALSRRAYQFGLKQFTVDDYQFLCRLYLGSKRAGRLDFPKIHRFAPKLNAHQLRSACTWLAQERGVDTERFLEYLRSQHMASNVDLGEVQAVDLAQLQGIDDVIESLEANLILPLENDALASEFDIKPKRGVLIAGPPGTGKTTIGRALAHRLKSKFFLIDGTFIAGTGQFYDRIQRVFDAAKQNAPSIIFIDDTDVIFENDSRTGLYRYLLTMLDGLESKSSGRVCVMMTAMNVGSLPPALIRSGRIELWLETRLPNLEARTVILSGRFAALPPAAGEPDARKIAAIADGLTGADLKRVVEDGKILMAFDRAADRPSGEPTDYFVQAIEVVRANKKRYAAAEEESRQQSASREPENDYAYEM